MLCFSFIAKPSWKRRRRKNLAVAGVTKGVERTTNLITREQSRGKGLEGRQTRSNNNDTFQAVKEKNTYYGELFFTGHVMCKRKRSG